jgi:hypothetical protein
MDVKYFGTDGYISTVAWAQDFVYALEERPKIFKLLFKLAIGRFAWREFVGMVEMLMKSGGYTPNCIGYFCEDNDYHKEHPELWGMR